MAYYSDELKWVFNPVPRTGSKSLAAFLEKNRHGKRYVSHHRLLTRAGYFHFSVVRNPFVRMLSLWWSWYRNPPSTRSARREAQEWPRFGKPISFAGLLEAAIEDPVFARKRIICSQCEHLNTIPFDATIKYEVMDLTTLPFIHKPTKIPVHKDREYHRLDRRERIPFAKVYSDPGVRRLVRAHSANDFQAFEYSTELPEIKVF
jgi:hypothetical protein